jgi:hypothetical protein
VQPFQSSARGNRLRTAPDSGPAKQRRRGPLVRPATIAILVDQDGRARFDRFFDEETVSGTAPFLFPDQQMDNYLAEDEGGLVLQDETGTPIIIESWWLVQFGQNQPAFTAVSGHLYNVQFDLVILP